MPYPNEVGLRMVIGGAAREAAMLGFHITPLFSYFAYHGPIYRVMVQLCNGKQDGIR
jgi:tRNA (guanine26-N2/guanine27-N2)-dimethyltransferase